MRDELDSPGSTPALQGYPSQGSSPRVSFTPPKAAVAPHLLPPGMWELQEGLVVWWPNGKARREDGGTVLLAVYLQ